MWCSPNKQQTKQLTCIYSEDPVPADATPPPKLSSFTPWMKRKVEVDMNCHWACTAAAPETAPIIQPDTTAKNEMALQSGLFYSWCCFISTSVECCSQWRKKYGGDQSCGNFD